MEKDAPLDTEEIPGVSGFNRVSMIRHTGRLMGKPAKESDKDLLFAARRPLAVCRERNRLVPAFHGGAEIVMWIFRSI